jgi:hypothetical protein
MRALCVSAVRGGSLFLGAFLAVSAQAQDAKVHRMEIRVGPNRTVHYFAKDATPGDRAVLRDLERAENEAAYADELLALRRQYVANEALFEVRRAEMQRRLYGIEMTGYGGYGGPAYFGPYFGGGGYYGGGYFGGIFPGGPVTTYQSLAIGVGYEGALKAEMARAIAAQATPEFASGSSRAYNSAVAQAAASKDLRGPLGLPANASAVAVLRPTVTLTLRGGDKVEGKLTREDGDWITIESAKEEVSVRKSEVVRITTTKAEKPEEK